MEITRNRNEYELKCLNFIKQLGTELKEKGFTDIEYNIIFGTDLKCMKNENIEIHVSAQNGFSLTITTTVKDTQRGSTLVTVESWEFNKNTDLLETMEKYVLN